MPALTMSLWTHDPASPDGRPPWDVRFAHLGAVRPGRLSCVLLNVKARFRSAAQLHLPT